MEQQYTLSTDEFAALNRVKAQSVRGRLARGEESYFGVKPKKLANNRLLWPNVVVKRDGTTEPPKLANVFACPNCGCHLAVTSNAALTERGEG